MSKINVDSLAVPAFSVAITDDGILRYDGINDILCQISGLTKEMFIGKTAAEFMSFEGAEAWEANYRRCLASGVMDEYEELAETPSGLRWWRTILSPVVDETGNIVQLLGLAADINDRKRAETELQTAVFVDAVTGIANRRRFELDLAAAMAQSVDRSVPFTLILADLDRFKAINDTMDMASATTFYAIPHSVCGQGCARRIASPVWAATSSPRSCRPQQTGPSRWPSIGSAVSSSNRSISDRFAFRSGSASVPRSGSLA